MQGWIWLLVGCGLHLLCHKSVVKAIGREGKVSKPGPSRGKAIKQKIIDQIKEFKPPHGEDRKPFAKDLACSACVHSIRELRYSISASVKRKYNGDAETQRKDKTAGVHRGIERACKRERFPDEMAVANLGGDMVMEYRPKEEVETRGNFMPSQEVVNEVVTICKILMGKLKQNITDKALNSQSPVGKIDWERWVCLTELQMCDETWFPMKEDSEGDADEDEL